ncbi:MAG: acylneuraminate cytidylyltransferase family protein [Bacteroidales bacterium]|nr:acylneuraminate cytidylyltransferase family protein [Bacteroidales bacterium]
MTPLIIIPARGGSKGIPHKNIKLLNGKPLICYSIDVARQYTIDENICVTTDDNEIISVVEQYGLKVPFVRPAELATDTASSNDVLVHALNFYESQGRQVDVVILLQPTSPFRKVSFVKEAVELYNEDLDMVVSVKETSANPYYNCFEEDTNGFLLISKSISHPITRRQDAPKVWEYNGSIYVINPISLKDKGMQHFMKIRKYPMPELYSVDIDHLFDWKIAELLLNENMIEL